VPVEEHGGARREQLAIDFLLEVRPPSAAILFVAGDGDAQGHGLGYGVAAAAAVVITCNIDLGPQDRGC
jgi:hypothetical protein